MRTARAVALALAASLPAAPARADETAVTSKIVAVDLFKNGLCVVKIDDTEIFLRYVRDDPFDDNRPGTSISIGFLAENFIDFGFPGMLAPLALMGLVLGGAVRYFMTRPVPLAVREGFVLAMVLSITGGMELSLAKFLGSTILISAVLAICLKFIYPSVERWIERRR